MAVFKCKMCGGTLEIFDNAKIGVCEYCGSQQTLPQLKDDKITRLYERANHLWRNKNYDKAMGVFETLLEEDNDDAEVYWSLVLCRYGIEYVEDPTSKKRIPTVNRMQYTSILVDADYKSALDYADEDQKRLYMAEAEEIDRIQQRILAVSQKEEPFDVFICYKESDENKQRTRDSVIATEIYQRLERENLRVFFSRITLEDKLGEDYEPYIFAALNSAKVMVVIGTKLEYFNSVWVKNEWSRYHALIQNGEKKMLIAAYKDLDPYDLPDELSMQAQDMNRMGFLEDLVHAVTKNVERNEPKKEAAPVHYVAAPANNSAEISTILKRVSIFLDGKDWSNADIYCEKALDIDPENAEAYIYKLMARIQVSEESQLVRSNISLSKMTEYKNAVRFADEATASRLVELNKQVEEKLAEIDRKNREAARRREEYEQMEAARANTTEVLTNLIREKEHLESNYNSLKYENDLSRYKNPKALITLSAVYLIFEIILISTFGSSFTGVAFIINAILCGILLKKDGKGLGLVFVNFITLGIFGIIYSIKVISKCNKQRKTPYTAEMQNVASRITEVDGNIDAVRKSLLEINSKLEEYNH